MATYDTLTSLLTAIANAIRSKTGETGQINAQDFPTKILSILQGSGNAQPSDVLSGKTFTNDSGEQTGTMANKGAWGTTINPGGSVTIPSGFHNGSGVVNANKSSGYTMVTHITGDTSSYTKSCAVNDLIIFSSRGNKENISCSNATLVFIDKSYETTIAVWRANSTSITITNTNEGTGAWCNGCIVRPN